MAVLSSHREFELVSVSPFGKDRRAVLVFPEPYSIASSNLAFHQIFRIVGHHEDWSCERATVEPSEKPRSFETGKGLDEFDLVAFTIPFELGYLNVLRALADSGIPLLGADRDENHPLILMGGIAVSANPAPMAPFCDLFLLGEGESSLSPALDRIAEAQNAGASKAKVLEACAALPGAYVPSLHGESPDPIRYARAEDLDAAPPCSAWLTPETEFDNTFLFEISRGCPCGCRFCMIRLSQKPLRAVSIPTILDYVDRLPEAVPSYVEGETVRPRIGLVGAAVASHPEFETICDLLRKRGWGITASAIEIDKVTEGMLELLASSQKTLTLAPERGDEGERFRLGKKIEDEHLLEVARRAGELGMSRLKMYFVVGITDPAFYGADSDRPGAPIDLPKFLAGTEGTEEYLEKVFEHEVESVAGLVERLADVFRPAGKPGTIAVTCSPFIPKPHTPWAGWPMAPEKSLKRLEKKLKRRIGKIPRARFRSFSGWEALLQGLLSQGGQDLQDFLVEVTDTPEELRSLSRRAVKEGVVRLHEKRWEHEPAPWDFVRL